MNRFNPRPVNCDSSGGCNQCVVSHFSFMIEGGETQDRNKRIKEEFVEKIYTEIESISQNFINRPTYIREKLRQCINFGENL